MSSDSGTAGRDVLGARLEDAIQEQKGALESRVANSGLYTHEVAEFDVAWEAYRVLFGRLGVKEDIGTLTTPESRNLVRKVALRGGGQAVLKVLGHTREPGEGEVLKAWHQSGLPCVEPIRWGYQRVTVGDGLATAAFLLTTYIPHSPEMHAERNEASKVGELTVWLQDFHRCDVRPSTVRTWIQRLAPHLQEVLPVIRRNELTEPTAWERKLRWLSDCGKAIIHGDPAPSNTVTGSAGRVLLDPPGAIMAMREADVAQVCWHWGDRTEAWDAITSACEADPTLNPEAIAAFLGFNYLIAAGYVLTSHTYLRLGRRLKSQDSRIDAARHLRVAAELIGQLHIER